MVTTLRAFVEKQCLLNWKICLRKCVRSIERGLAGLSYYDFPLLWNINLILRETGIIQQKRYDWTRESSKAKPRSPVMWYIKVKAEKFDGPEAVLLRRTLIKASLRYDQVSQGKPYVRGFVVCVASR